jgi:hypothetical protein
VCCPKEKKKKKRERKKFLKIPSSRDQLLLQCPDFSSGGRMIYLNPRVTLLHTLIICSGIYFILLLSEFSS